MLSCCKEASCSIGWCSLPLFWRNLYVGVMLLTLKADNADVNSFQFYCCLLKKWEEKASGCRIVKEKVSGFQYGHGKME